MTAAPSAPPVVSVRDLRVQFAQPGTKPVRAVDGVDLDLPAGATVCLVGESGCGKTTLALTLGRLLPEGARITAGSIRLGEWDLTRLPEKELRRVRGGGIAFIFQDPLACLNPVMSVGEQLVEAIRLHGAGEETDRADRTALDLLRQVRISEPKRRLSQYPHQLSGGMRQRVMIAMALAGRPKLLVADEPTTALDVTTQAEILATLRALQRERGMAVLLITHDLKAVAPHSDRICVMYAGRIVETAATERFYRNAQHPYAQALLKCLPRIGRGRQAFEAIPGSVPDLSDIPPGCPFHPRCPEAVERCRAEDPPLEPVEPDHPARCWRRPPHVR